VLWGTAYQERASPGACSTSSSPIFVGFCALSAAMARQRSTNYLAGRRVFAPFDQEIPNPGSMGKACGGNGFSWLNTRVDPTRVGVG
jgi:hypothetical protein